MDRDCAAPFSLRERRCTRKPLDTHGVFASVAAAEKAIVDSVVRERSVSLSGCVIDGTGVDRYVPGGDDLVVGRVGIVYFSGVDGCAAVDLGARVEVHLGADGAVVLEEQVIARDGIIFVEIHDAIVEVGIERSSYA